MSLSLGKINGLRSIAASVALPDPAPVVVLGDMDDRSTDFPAAESECDAILKLIPFKKYPSCFCFLFVF